MIESNLPVEVRKLYQDLEKKTLPPELSQRVVSMLESLSRSFSLPNYIQELQTTERYLTWVLALPWATSSTDNLDVGSVSQVLNEEHYALAKIKERILEYVSVLKLTAKNGNVQNTILCFTGLPGLGKTSVAASIAKALRRKFIRIPFGGLGEVSQIRGLPRYLPSAEPGQIIKGLRRTGVSNPVILLDEIDRVAETSRPAIMGTLLELLDPEQNCEFTDYYLDYPFNLSRVLFICTANNTRNIANALLDRLEVMEMPSYSDEEKIIIGQNYLLPKVVSQSGLSPDQLTIGEGLWGKIIRPLGYDAGIRSLERTLEAICRKTARKIVEGQGEKFVIDEANVKEFLNI